MPLIKLTETETVLIKSRFPKSLETEIRDYMKWIGLQDIGMFLEQAARYILSRDKEWKRHHKK